MATTIIPGAESKSRNAVPQRVATRVWSRMFPQSSTQWLNLAIEVALGAVSFLLTFSIFASGHEWRLWPLIPALLVVVPIRSFGLMLLGPFKSSLRHADAHELLEIVKAVTLSSVILTGVLPRAGILRSDFSLAFFVLDWALLILLLGSFHFGARLYRSELWMRRKAVKQVAIVGAGDAGMTLVRELVSDPTSRCRPVAIFDDDPKTHGTTICGIPVAGSVDELSSLPREKRVEEVLICIPSATQSEMSRIVSICCRANFPVRTLPALAEILDGTVSPQDLRSLRVEDLLQREELRPEPKQIEEVVKNQVVLITGAGGSIGSELSRQIALGSPEALLLLDKTENSLFYIHRELQERFPSLRLKPLLCDVSRRNHVEEIMRSEKPAVVFHAAAYKHVGLLELHPMEAIRNNVLGTRNVAVAAMKNGVKRFVNISTDKAVNPENYMGLSKKLTELCIQELSGRNGATRFMNVRFGNVAGSTGSVLRLFWDQIQKNEPIHVTDPRATRYFMSIPEAVHLILRAARQGRGGETFVLEMGEPINIYELAKSMSLLAGLTPGKELPIYFVGLREGEKVNEELWADWEVPVPSSQRGVLMIPTHDPHSDGILSRIDGIEALLNRGDRQALDETLGELFPRFMEKKHSAVPITSNGSARNMTNFPEVRVKIPLSKPDIGEREMEMVMDVLQSGRLSLGPKLLEFEEKFAKYIGARYAVATNSGTSALHLCIRALGIGPGDEVITTPFSFVASTNCILFEGATPAFVDIDPDTLNIDPIQLKRFLRDNCLVDARQGVLIDRSNGRRVKAILPVHVFGVPCDMNPILALAREYKLHVVEDACEALGAEYCGRRAGTFGDVATFAFYPNKQITTGEGGMIVTNDENLAKHCRSMRNQGRGEDASWLSHARLGYNYRLSEMQCALGIAQLERVAELLEGRKRVAAAYHKALARIPHLLLPSEFDDKKRSWFVYVVQLALPAPKTLRDRVMVRLREQGVECQAYFPAIHKQPHVAGTSRLPAAPLYCAEEAADRCFALPFYPSLSDSEIEYVRKTLSRILAEEVKEFSSANSAFAASAASD
ncbi:MAG TPA: DegT/DnrJ/EryC1/StrS family aminotransferase [Candidatus Acidoferrum sp.]|nr:DegT/DnrJ/EryC1/StrS family aminotransferase [Candidatus Acidoferrum sp.]